MTFNNIGSLLIREKLFKFLKENPKIYPIFLSKVKELTVVVLYQYTPVQSKL